jgi:hypothetical protein
MAKETSTGLVLLMDSVAVATVGTWVKFEKVGRECGHKKMKKKFPFLMLRVGPTGPRTKLMFGYSRN